MRKIKLVSLLLAVLQLLLLFSACGNGEPGTTGTAAGTTEEMPTTQGRVETPTTQNQVETPTTETPTTGGEEEEEDPYLYLVLDGEAQYTIVGSYGVDSEITAKVVALAEALTEKTGAEFSHTTDRLEPETDYEILFCAGKHREDALEVLRSMTYTEFRAEIVGERILLASYSNYMDRLSEYLLSSLYELEEGTWVCDRYAFDFSSDSISASRAVPHYDTENGIIQGHAVYQNAQGGYTVSIEKTNAAEFAAYKQKLERLGYALHSENKIGMVDFAVYTNGERTLYLQYNTSDYLNGITARITSTMGESLPATTPPEYVKRVDAKIIQPQVDGHLPYGNGMSMLFQLSDGSFIIADGSVYTAKDMSWMVNYLYENTPEGMTPTISLWLWTHAHGDHVDFAKNAMEGLKSAGIDLKAFAHNFPDWKAVSNATVSPAPNYSDDLVALTKRVYPNAVEWVMHAGQQMYVADATVECYWTHEDVHPMPFSTFNDTGSVFSITIDGIRTMILGDCQNPNTKMISWYKEALRSVLVQNSHHSSNGPKQMYEYIDPIISFWACPESWVTTGSQGKTDHGKYLLNTQWTRTNEKGKTVTGDRIHYTNSHHDEIYIKDLKAAYGTLR